jgi:methyl-coenzyme M reductase beta subunit
VELDFYDEKGKLIAEGIPLNSLDFRSNKNLRKMVSTFRRTVFIDLHALENTLKNGLVGGEMIVGNECKVLGVELEHPIVENKEEIIHKLQEYLATDEITAIEDLLVIKVPMDDIEIACDSVSSPILKTSVALTQSIAEIFDLNIFDGVDLVKTALLGRYPQNVAPNGLLKSFLKVPTKVEGLSSSYRSMSVNDIVALSGKKVFDSVAMAWLLEFAAANETGYSVGWYKRLYLLGFAYQGLNANNLTYELVKECKKGTLYDVVDAVVQKACEDKIIENLDGIYYPSDMPLWNAYAASGQLAATIIECGAIRSAQSVGSIISTYNDLLQILTGLPSVEFGRAMGSAIFMNWLSHSIYGGGGAGVFSGEHVSVKGSRGFLIPCICAAMCFDVGTQLFVPDTTSKNMYKIREALPELHDIHKRIIYSCRGDGDE